MERHIVDSGQVRDAHPRPKGAGAGRDVVVAPWREGWAVLRVGGKRPGRVRATREEALKDGQAFARVERSRLFLAPAPVDFDAVNELARQGALTEGFGPPIADRRVVVSRRDSREVTPQAESLNRKTAPFSRR